MHLNICSILPKMDLVDIWVNDTNPDVFVFSETWLNNSIEDDSIRNIMFLDVAGLKKVVG